MYYIYTDYPYLAVKVQRLIGSLFQNSPPICEAAWKHRRLASELRSLQKEPPEGIQAVPLDRDCRFFQALIVGPKGSPYEGGRFYLYLQIPKR